MSQDPNQPNAGARPFWTIGPVQDRPVLGSGGTFVEGKAVDVQFWDGSTETLLVPKSQYNETVIAQLAQQAADTHLKVKALQGPMLPADLLGS